MRLAKKLSSILPVRKLEEKIALWTEITPPGGGPPPHYRLNEDELFFGLAHA